MIMGWTCNVLRRCAGSLQRGMPCYIVMDVSGGIRKESCVRVAEALMCAIFAHAPPVPMPARWSQVTTTALWYCLAFAVHGVFARVFAACFNPKADVALKNCIIVSDQVAQAHAPMCLRKRLARPVNQPGCHFRVLHRPTEHVSGIPGHLRLRALTL